MSRSPLLSNAASPGMSRISQSSLNSTTSMLPSSQNQYSQSSLGHSSSGGGGGRFGPTAQIGGVGGGGISSAYDSQSGVGSGEGLHQRFTHDELQDQDDEMDDHLHTFTAAEQKNVDHSASLNLTSWRGWANALTLGFIAMACIGIFALYPIFDFYMKDDNAMGANTAGYNLGGINSTGQYPSVPGLPKLIDDDTPEDAKTWTSLQGEEWQLVFSDEFNKDGRTFFPGDDPFFTAVDLHYWGTNDFEWLDPSAATTKDGHLVITMSQEPIHDLNLKSAQLQSWNQLCFNKNAYVSMSASLPGHSHIGGFWPGFWLMGNLGRPAYGASTDGEYTYDSCDIGTLANQTWPNGTAPIATLTTGENDGVLSYLPGQRLSACTCPGEDHPGPDVSVGRAAPEIDIVEAQIRIAERHGEVSQSNQVAPYDDYYQFNNRSGFVHVYDEDLTMFNTYLGGYYQQAVSGLTLLPDRIYSNQVVGGRSGEFTEFGVEWSAFPEEREKGYISWVSDGKRSWTMYADAVDENPRTGVGRRIVSEEPMAIIINLHASNNFQFVDWANMIFPNYFRIDWVRVYQRPDGSGTIGCDPADHPTKDYIERHLEVYTNPNLTTWVEGAGKTWPKNRLIDQC
ncbi:glucosidase [Kwoniella mangroviensis CBS 10435]|uniref:Glucosidase n=1 Tax=Kwoniella mangroviensis CBS 10435 TaxID=1331196 RepID=A0A1B9IZD8_9TREE|nr:glucosidase [Kwoniella mangroviensis CBS 10435]